MTIIQINWKHQFELADFADKNKCKKLKDQGGIYLWVRKNDGAIWYVGEAVEFLDRFEDHFVNHIGGMYWIFNLAIDNQETNSKDWPGNEHYQPSQTNKFECISNLNCINKRSEDAYKMLKQSTFLFGEIEYPDEIESADIKTKKKLKAQCRKEAEGSILRFFYDTYYQPDDIARIEHILGSINKNPDVYGFCHVDHIDMDNGHYCLKNTIDFYEKYKGEENFPFKICPPIKTP